MRRLRPSGAGPLAWCGILLATTLALYLFQQVLWLVLPFLFGLIAYYFLAYPMQRLMFAGLSQESAANITVGVFALLLVGAFAFMLPRFAAQAVGVQETGMRYLQGGLLLLDQTLRALEDRSGFMRDAHVADAVSSRLREAVLTPFSLATDPLFRADFMVLFFSIFSPFSLTRLPQRL